MGYRFTLILDREVTDNESVALREAGCNGATFGIDSLPTNADVQVTKLDFDDTVSPSLAEAIESALEAVKKVPDLTVPGLTVPAQPATAEQAEKQAAAAQKPDVVAGEVLGTADAEKPAAEGKPAAEQKPAAKATAKKTAAKKPAAKKPAAKKPAARKASSNGNGNGNGKADSAAEPEAAYAGSADSSR